MEPRQAAWNKIISNHVSYVTLQWLADQIHHIVATAAAHTIGQRL
jgi:hypothetical protein